MSSKLIITVFLGIFSTLGAGGSVPAVAAPVSDDACSSLTQAQVSGVLGVSVGAGSHQPLENLKTCIWSSANAPLIGRKSVTLNLKTAEAYEGGKKLLEQAKALAEAEKDEDAQVLGTTPVSGIGDNAFYSTDGVHTTLSVKKGNAAFDVTVAGDLPGEKAKAMEKTLAQDVLAKM